MTEGLGIGKRRLIADIVLKNWELKRPEDKKFTFAELLFVVQEMLDEEGKKYFEKRVSRAGHTVFKYFVKHLLYRNLANYDSMILMTSEKGCITGDALLEMPRDLKKYPKGIPLKELVGKGPLYVYCFNIKTQKIELKKCDGVEFVKNDDVGKIILDNGQELKGTYDHPILLENNKYKQLKELKIGEGVRTNNGISYVIDKKLSLGKEDVFDVVNVQDNHNFIVNSFVVSNTGKSSAAIMMARYWCSLIGIKFNPARHIAYSNADVMRKVDQLQKFEPLVADEAIRFASAAEWAKKENKQLKKKLAEVRTKHLLYILCFPLKIYKLEKTYLESYTNYWIDLFGRGQGAIYVKDKNPNQDSWRLKEFSKIGSYTEFTTLTKIEKQLKKHPNFWQIIKFPKPPDWLYTRYLKVREANVYDDENVMANVSKQDIHNALLILALRDIMTHDVNINMNRIILHCRNEYDLALTKGMIQASVDDAKQLITKIREQLANK